MSVSLSVLGGTAKQAAEKVFSQGSIPPRLEAAIDGAAFTARVELVHPSKPNPGLPGAPVVPFPKPARSGVLPQPLK
ncbi:MAG: hypothetical protein WAM89_14175, partial [Terriglobales bacterium]